MSENRLAFKLSRVEKGRCQKSIAADVRPNAADVFTKSDRCPPRTKVADVKHFYFEFLGESGRCTLTLVPYPNSKVNTSAAFRVNVFTVKSGRCLIFTQT